MSRLWVSWGLVWVAGALALAACKSDTANDVGSDPIVLLDPGAEPRAPIRYAIPRGTITSSTMDIEMAELATTRMGSGLSLPPKLRLQVVSGPTLEGNKGTIRMDIRVVKAEAVPPEGTDPALQLEMNRAVSVLNNIGGWVEMDDRGIIRASELNTAAKDPAVPARLLLALINTRTSLARVMMPFEPVGAGARWKSQKKITFYGFEVDQVDTYTLVKREDNVVELQVEIMQSAPAQSVTFEGQGTELSLESLSMSAQGGCILNLNAVESISRASGQANEVLSVKTVEGAEIIELNSAFAVETLVTGTMVEPLPTKATPKLD